MLDRLSKSLLTMHGQSPKEPIPPSAVRDRPLQKSMFLPEHYPPMAPMPHVPPNDHSTSFNHLKRSLIENNPNSSGPNQFQFRTQPANSNILSFNNSYQMPPSGHSPFAALDSRTGSHSDLLHHSNSTSNIKHANSFSRQELIDPDPKAFTKNDKNKISGEPDSRNWISEAVKQIRDLHLPLMVNAIKKELQDEIHALRNELASFREDFKKNQGRQEGPDLKGLGRNSEGTKPRASTSDAEELKDLRTNFFLMDGKIRSIEAKFAQEFASFNKSLQKLSVELQDHKPDEKSIKPGIRSSLPTIMLEYREIFAVRVEGRRGQEEIQIGTSSYCVDKHGYLLDSENRYLVDRRGSQIRLDDKHLKLLEKHRILFK